MVRSSILVLFERILRVFIGFLVTAKVISYLGPEHYGAWALAIAVTSLFSFFPSLSLEGILTRELVARGGEDDADVLGAIFFLKLIGGACGYVLIASYSAFFVDSVEVRHVLLITALVFFVQPFDIFEYFLQVKGRIASIVICRSASLFLTSGLKIYGLISSKSLLFFVVVTSLELVVTLGIMLIYYVSNGGPLRRLRFHQVLALRFLREAFPLILSSIAVLLYMRLDQLMLAYIKGESAVGTYSVAVKFTEIWYFIPGSLATIILQQLSKNAGEDAISKLNSSLREIYVVFWTASIGLACAVTIATPFLIPALFGEQFGVGIWAAQIYGWTLPASFLGVVSSQYLLLNKRTAVLLKRTLLGLALNFIANLIFIPAWGITGAAVATMLSYNVAAFSMMGRGHFRLMVESAHPREIHRLLRLFLRQLKEWVATKY